MLDAVYAVKASEFSDPFIAFADAKCAYEVAHKMHPDMEPERSAELVSRIPLFASYAEVGAARGLVVFGEEDERVG